MTTKQQSINKINRLDDSDLLHEIYRWIRIIVEATTGEAYSKEESSGLENYQIRKRLKIYLTHG